MPARVLVTGAGGFVGGHLVDRLLEAIGQGSVILAMSRARLPVGCQTATVDVLDADAVGQLVESFGPDLVIHLAAQSSIGNATNTAEATWRINLVGTLNIATACARHAPDSAFIFASSGEVYGASLKASPVKETAPVSPLNTYARTKLAAEYMLGDVLGMRNKLVILRAFNHSGAGQDVRFVLPSFAKQIAEIEVGRQSPVVVTGNLDVARDFLHVSDVVEAYIKLAGRLRDLPSRSIFNVSSGFAVSLRDILGTLKQLARVDFKLEADPGRFRASDVVRAAGDNSLLSDFCGWQPRIPLISLLSEVLNHARSTFKPRVGSVND